MQFKDIVGQDAVKAKLLGGVAQGRVGHAQLFVGEEGTGALPLAIAYAQYLNCPNRTDGDSCGVCASCHQIGQLAHPDLHFVFPVNTPRGKSGDKPVSDHYIELWREQVLSTGGYFGEQMWYATLDIENKQGNISKFEADAIIRKLSFKAFESRYKIVIIWLPERMNVQASNTLLKILEEPWDNTVFLMVSESPDKLLATILSRMQTVNVPGIDPGAMAAWLTAQGVSAGDAPALARLSRGSLVEARRCMGAGSGEDVFFDMFVLLMRLSYEDRHMELLEWAENAASLGREEQKRLMVNSIRLIRDSYMMTAGMDELAFLYGKELAFCRKFAPYVNNNNVEAIVREMELVIAQIARNGSPKIVFTHFALAVSKLVNKLQR